MNKIIFYLKNLLMILIMFLYIMCFKRFNQSLEGYNLKISCFCLIALLITLIFLSILDFKQKNRHMVYNLLFIFIELLLIFVFLRTLYDPNFILNGMWEGIFNIAYLLQNMKYFIVMLIALIIYRKINK